MNKHIREPPHTHVKELSFMHGDQMRDAQAVDPIQKLKGVEGVCGWDVIAAAGDSGLPGEQDDILQ